MPRACSVCAHEQRDAINQALVSGESAPAVVARYSTTRQPFGRMAVWRHRDEHLPALLTKAQDAAEVAHADLLMTEIRRCMARVQLLFDACDRWLRDPEHPEQYDVGPRSEDVRVVYTELVDGKTVRKRDHLSVLLARLEEGAGITIEKGEYRHADPRELILKTAAQTQSSIELLAKLLGELDERPTVNLIMAPQWSRLVAGLRDVLAPHPAILAQVSAHLLTMEDEEAARAG